MYTTWISVLFFLALSGFSSYSCEPPRPKLPEQVSFGIEVVFKSHKLAYTLFEYYDYPNNRWRLEYTKDGIEEHDIFLLDEGAQYTIEHKNGEYQGCSVKEATNSDFSKYMSEGHLKNTQGFFNFLESAVYLRSEDWREIPADVWGETIISEDGSSHYVEFYVLAESGNWTYNTESSDVILGTTVAGNVSINDEIFFYEYEQNFFGWTVGQPDEFLFLTPRFLACGNLEERAIPELGDSFWTAIELTMQEANVTTTIREAVDFENNRMAWVYETDDRTSWHFVFGDEDVSYTIEGEDDCETKPLSESKFDSGRAIVDSSGHIFNSSQTLFGRYPSEYQGKRTIRGIKCDFWHAHADYFTEDQKAYVEFEQDMFFSVPEWKNLGIRGGLYHQVPVRSEIKGTYYVDPAGDNTSYPFHHVYEFVAFTPGTPPDSTFQLQDEWKCMRADERTLPPIPDNYFAAIEVNIINKNYTSKVLEYYDFENNRARFQFHARGSSYVELILAEEDVRYEIVDGNCTGIQVNGSSGSFLTSSSQHVFSSSKLFAFPEENSSHGNTTWGGFTSVRGIKAEFWITYVNTDLFSRPGSNVRNVFTLKHYFSLPSWDIKDSNGVHRIPLRIQMTGSRLTAGEETGTYDHIYEFLDFEPRTPDPKHFLPNPEWRCRHPSHEPYPLPKLSDSFQTFVEFSDLNNNETSNGFFGYSEKLNKAVYSLHYRGEYKREFLYPEDGQFGTRYEITGSFHSPNHNCTAFSMENTTVVEGHSLISVSRLFRFGGSFIEDYEGRTTVRGIPADYWITDAEDTVGDWKFVYTTENYFSLPPPNHWSFPVPVDHPIPLRTVTKGTGTNLRTNEVTDLHHEWNYVDYKSPAEPERFDIHPQWGCLSPEGSDPASTVTARPTMMPSATGTTRVTWGTESTFTERKDDTEDDDAAIEPCVIEDDDEAASVIGALFGGVLAGAIIQAVISYFIFKKRTANLAAVQL